MRFRTALALMIALVAVPLGAAPAHADPPGLSINDVTVQEPANYWFPTRAHFAVTLDRASDEPVTVQVAADPGTNGHFSRVATTLTFSPGETVRGISIEIRDNDRWQPPQVYPVTLSQATGAKIADDTGQLTVLNTNPKDSVVGCRATVARWRAGLKSGTYGVANPADSPCISDAQEGPTQGATHGVYPVYVGARARSWTARTTHSDKFSTARASASELDASASQLAIELASLDSSVEVHCTWMHTPMTRQRSTVEELLVYVEYDIWNIYLVDQATAENQRFELPDGTVVEINRTLRATSQRADGTLVHHVTQQAVVVTSPSGAEVVLGEASLSYADDQCTI